jgi:hypothetical protein
LPLPSQLGAAEGFATRYYAVFSGRELSEFLLRFLRVILRPNVNILVGDL